MPAKSLNKWIKIDDENTHLEIHFTDGDIEVLLVDTKLVPFLEEIKWYWNKVLHKAYCKVFDPNPRNIMLSRTIVEFYLKTSNFNNVLMGNFHDYRFKNMVVRK